MALTLADFRTRVRERTDMVGSNYVTDAEIDRYVNQAARELSKVSMEIHSMPELAKTASFNTVAGTSGYAFATIAPGAILKTVSFQYLVGLKLYPIHREQDLLYRVEDVGTTVWDENTRPTYRFSSAKVEFRPTPGNVVPVIHMYIDGAIAMAADGDSLPKWLQRDEDYIITRACISVRDKEESDTTVLRDELARYVDGMRVVAESQEAGMGLETVDVMFSSRIDNSDPWGNPWP